MANAFFNLQNMLYIKSAIAIILLILLIALFWKDIKKIFKKREETGGEKNG